MNADATARLFRPLKLHLDRIGPFQDGVTTIPFLDNEGEPCSFFLLVSRNGRGKTTAMEAMYFLMNSLAGDIFADVIPPRLLLDNPQARAQLDLLVEMGTQTVVLSLMLGIPEDSSLEHWSTEKLEEYAATAWDRYAVFPRWKGRFSERNAPDDDGILPQLAQVIHEATRRPPVGFGVNDLNPETAPVLLYFPSNRDISRVPETERRTIGRPMNWDYQPARRFDQDTAQWSSSLDNLLVWLKWLDEARFEAACQTINETVFKGSQKRIIGVRRDPPEAIVENEGQRHRLDQLSSGEKSLIVLFLLLSAHMTRNTIVLIDEVDLHLHPEWERRVVQQLKNLLRQHAGLTVIISAHSKDVLQRFDVNIPELDMRKGGELLADERPTDDVEGRA
ncbi:MAG TPA: AAA family ATPase [Polyangium sp.]|nr:AAA family ATPase [Polyangium sp.]